MAMTPEQILEVRSLIPDDSSDTAQQAFSDASLQAIYAGTGKESVARTVAWACLAMGGSDLIIGKVIQNDEIRTDGSKTAAEWRLRARMYFDIADEEDGSGDYFDLVDPDPEVYCPPEASPFPYRWPF